MPKWQLIFYHLETSKASMNRGETKRTNPTNQISPLPHRTEVEICHGRLLREIFPGFEPPQKKSKLSHSGSWKMIKGNKRWKIMKNDEKSWSFLDIVQRFLRYHLLRIPKSFSWQPNSFSVRKNRKSSSKATSLSSCRSVTKVIPWTWHLTSNIQHPSVIDGYKKIELKM